MSDYKIINDNGYERTWEELYEDNVRFQKYTNKLQKQNKKYKEVIDKAIEFIESFRKDNMEFYKNKGVALTISECDGLLEILKGDSNE